MTYSTRRCLQYCSKYVRLLFCTKTPLECSVTKFPCTIELVGFEDAGERGDVSCGGADASLDSMGNVILGQKTMLKVCSTTADHHAIDDTFVILAVCANTSTRCSIVILRWIRMALSTGRTGSLHDEAHLNISKETMRAWTVVQPARSVNLTSEQGTQHHS